MNLQEIRNRNTTISNQNLTKSSAENDTWNAEDVIKKIMIRHTSEKTIAPIQNQQKCNFYYSDGDAISLEVLEQTRVKVACLYKIHGDAILPLFERIEAEIKLSGASLKVKERIMEMSLVSLLVADPA